MQTRPLIGVIGLIAAFALLAESFGREVWWLWRQGRVQSTTPTVVPVAQGIAVPRSGWEN